MHSHLLHDVGTMDFDCLLQSAQLAGDLFVQFASNDVFEHFPLTSRERKKARADFVKFSLLSSKGSVFLNRRTNGCDQPIRSYFSFSLTSANAFAANSKSSRECAADTCVRTRAVPCGTTG